MDTAVTSPPVVDGDGSLSPAVGGDGSLFPAVSGDRSLSPAVSGDRSRVFKVEPPEYELWGRTAALAGTISD